MVDVSLRKLRKTFPDGTVAVHDLDLEIPDREFLTLLGPSGCGKTTTLRMIAGIESPTSGNIDFGGRRVNEIAPAARNIAMVFQNYALYPHMTVAQNLEYPLRKRGVAKVRRSVKINEVANALKIDSLLQRRPKQLSGGQQQRVALGRAMIRNPEVFLLDEPLSNLDAALRGHMRIELIQLHRRLGATMIYVTHDQMEAMTMSTRIAVMHQGHLQQVGTPDEAYNAPANRFVASFIGTPSMNLFEGRLVEAGAGLAFQHKDFRVELSPEAANSMPASALSRPVVMGVRPEDVLIGKGEHVGQIEVVEPTGHEVILFLMLAANPLVARCRPDTSIKASLQLPVSFQSSKLHLFDLETGLRLNGRV